MLFRKQESILVDLHIAVLNTCPNSCPITIPWPRPNMSQICPQVVPQICQTCLEHVLTTSQTCPPKLPQITVSAEQLCYSFNILRVLVSLERSGRFEGTHLP